MRWLSPIEVKVEQHFPLTLTSEASARVSWTVERPLYCNFDYKKTCEQTQFFSVNRDKTRNALAHFREI